MKQYSTKSDSHSIETITQTPILGDLQNTYYVKMNFRYFLPGCAVFYLFLFGVSIFIASKDFVLLFACAALPFALFCWLVWSLFAERKDELKVYKNGFTYQSRKEFHLCLWDEIEDYTTVRRGNELTAVKKSNGKWIHFANEIQGLDELKSHLRKVIK